MKRIAALLLVAFFSVGMTACNTVAGMGKDVSAAGNKVSDKAQGCKDMKC